MHQMPIALALSALFLGLTVADVQAEAVKVTPRLTVFTDKPAASADGLPTVLRGDATRRGTVDGRFGAALQASRFQLGAGAKLWLTDPVSGDVIVCDERRSSQVGGRFIGCVADRLPYALYE